MEIAKCKTKKRENESMLEVDKFMAQKSSNVRNGSALEVNENILILKSLLASKTPQFQFLTICETALFVTCIIDSL